MAFGEKDYLGREDRFKDRSLRKEIFIVIFGTHTRAGKLFDIILLVLILISVAAVMLESVSYIKNEYGTALVVLEWVLTILFTIEYFARIIVVQKPAKYIISWFGLIDLFAILPTYLSLFLVGSQGLAVIRALRLLRIFRILKLTRFVSESDKLAQAILMSRHKITVFFMFLMIIVFILGSIMYLVEGANSGFNSIPRSIYWAIVTLTTVGFGDITPTTIFGQMIASVIMLLGYSIIAIPTGIVGAEFYREVFDQKKPESEESDQSVKCHVCGERKHPPKAQFCHNCGSELPREKDEKEKT
ncbi:MAG: ion transporter [Cryomorphaceae bacterium]|nr:ion transporter [Flavobacteriales bacterium]